MELEGRKGLIAETFFSPEVEMEEIQEKPGSWIDSLAFTIGANLGAPLDVEWPGQKTGFSGSLSSQSPPPESLTTDDSLMVASIDLSFSSASCSEHEQQESLERQEEASQMDTLMTEEELYNTIVESLRTAQRNSVDLSSSEPSASASPLLLLTPTPSPRCSESQKL